MSLIKAIEEIFGTKFTYEKFPRATKVTIIATYILLYNNIDITSTSIATFKYLLLNAICCIVSDFICVDAHNFLNSHP